MKTALLLAAAALGIAAVTQSVTNAPLILKPAKEEMPRVIVNSTRQEAQPLCPVVGDGRPSDYHVQAEQINEFGEKVIMEYIHCRKCEIGALFPLEDKPTAGRCSYCHELYEGLFTGE